tara:strand:- start:2646 stop:3341 length:696 start_codon:yes stop_codon:yes gene_type:complete
MIKIRRSKDRGASMYSWLKSYHTFSFANYYDPKFSGELPLLVINDDTVDPSKGFDVHPHKNMEIISYVINGTLEHKDSMGNISVINKGDIQKMSAGTGVLHSEYNASSKDKVHFLQIWILPKTQNTDPSYDQKHFSDDDKLNNFKLVASGSGSKNSIVFNQDVNIYASIFKQHQDKFIVNKNKKLWLHNIKGELSINSELLKEGDGAFIKDIDYVNLKANNSEFIIFEMNK